MFDVHFDEPDAAEAFLAVLAERGIAAELSVDVFAGEDDLDDAARIVHVAGVDDVDFLAELATGHAGWVVSAQPQNLGNAAYLAELPEGPKRFKR